MKSPWELRIEPATYTILNVDGDERKRSGKSRILRRAGYRVIEARDGAEALQLILEASPQLIVLDVKLPDISGIEICRRIKANPDSCRMMVLQVSASQLTSDDRIESLEVGADFCLTEPVTSEELLASVKALLRLYRREEENRDLLAKVRESEERLRLALDAAKLGAWDHRPDTGEVVRDEHGYRQFGVPASTMDYASVMARIHPEDREAVDRSVKQALAGEEDGSHQVDFRVVWPDGSIHWLASHGRVYFSGEGSERRAARFIGVNMDITERKQAEEALKEAGRRKDEFLATLAHELRNPLAPIRNAVQILRLKGPPSEELEWAENIIDRQIQQMIRLIDDLLDVSRITHDKLELRKQTVELARVVESAIETSRPLIEESNHQLTVSLPKAPVYLEADEIRLAQIFSNLLNNAAKYTAAGGRIQLTAEKRRDAAVVTVKDSGIGIPKSKLSHVFEMFAQIDSSLGQTRGGLGIGLTLAKRLVHLHGGTIEAKSDGPGKGSEFIVRLPITRQGLNLEQLRSAADGQQALPTSSLRVLIVDDNRNTANSLAMVLRTMGNEIRIAHDGEEAISIAKTFEPEVALLDIGLPKLNGYEVCRRIRQEPWGRTAVVVALTGWGRKEDFSNAQEAGFDHHIVKPANPEEVMKLVAGSGYGG
jgi:PAS domain S-box-containing protein